MRLNYINFLTEYTNNQQIDNEAFLAQYMISQIRLHYFITL